MTVASLPRATEAFLTMREFFGTFTPGLKFADLHIHTTFSRDVKEGGLQPVQVIDLATRWGLLRALAITDHDTIEGARQAQTYAREISSSVEVIIGEEVTTTEGHLLGLYIQKDISKGRSVEWTIACIREQGGLVIVPHFNFSLARSIKQETLLGLLMKGLTVDGFEVFNRGVRDIEFIRNGGREQNGRNEQAMQFFLNHRSGLGAPLGSSDNHHRGIGRGLTGYRGDLKEAIKDKQTQVFYLDHDEQQDLRDFTTCFFGPYLGLRMGKHLERRGIII